MILHPIDKKYAELLALIKESGHRGTNRTGIDTLTIPSFSITHDVGLEGFPIISLRRIAMRSVLVELAGFLLGATAKSWYQHNGCTIWDEWCNPKKVPYGNDEETKERMKAENDLGRIYGAQWTKWKRSDGLGDVDQILEARKRLMNDRTDRRALVSAWRPDELDQMALPPCHTHWQISAFDGERLNLSFSMRSVDVPLGLPFNLASYGTLLCVLAKDLGFKPGVLTAHLNLPHIYVNQLDGVNEMLSRFGEYENHTAEMKRKIAWQEHRVGIIEKPKLVLPREASSLLSWVGGVEFNPGLRDRAKDDEKTKISRYYPGEKISMPIAV